MSRVAHVHGRAERQQQLHEIDPAEPRRGVKRGSASAFLPRQLDPELDHQANRVAVVLPEVTVIFREIAQPCCAMKVQHHPAIAPKTWTLKYSAR